MSGNTRERLATLDRPKLDSARKESDSTSPSGNRSTPSSVASDGADGLTGACGTDAALAGGTGQATAPDQESGDATTETTRTAGPRASVANAASPAVPGTKTTQKSRRRGASDESGARYGKPTAADESDEGPRRRGRSPVQTTDYCQSCESEALDVGSAEVVCRECGYVQKEDCLDHGPEWRAYQDGDGRDTDRRVGPAVTELLHDRGLSTKISFKNVDANGNSLSPRRRNLFERLRNWQSRTNATDSRSRNLKHALGEVQRVAFTLDLSKSVASRAARIYRQLLDEGAVRGWAIEVIAAVSVYMVVREDRRPITLKEVEEVARDGPNNMNRAYLHACQELDASIHPQLPSDFLPRILSDLDAPSEVRTIASRLVELAEDEGLASGKEPNGVAGGAVYLAYSLTSEEQVTQDEASRAARVCIVTIRARRDDIRELLSERDGNVADIEVQGC